MNDGTNIFIDANIFTYYVGDHPVFADACEKLLLEVETERCIGVTSIFVLNEVFHKIMMLEACDRFTSVLGRAAQYLKVNPHALSSLTTYRKNIERIKQINNLRVLEVPSQLFSKAIDFSGKYGMLATDAIHLATMHECSIRTIATNDRDFERIEWLNIRKPLEGGKWRSVNFAPGMRKRGILMFMSRMRSRSITRSGEECGCGLLDM